MITDNNHLGDGRLLRPDRLHRMQQGAASIMRRDDECQVLRAHLGGWSEIQCVKRYPSALGNAESLVRKNSAANARPLELES